MFSILSDCLIFVCLVFQELQHLVVLEEESVYRSQLQELQRDYDSLKLQLNLNATVCSTNSSN